MSRNVDLDRLGDIFKNTLSLMKNAMQDLAKRNSTIYNLLYTSDNMQNKHDNYNELLSSEMHFDRNKIIKWVLIALIIYMAFMVFSYLFVNYILFYFVIFSICFIIIKYIVYYYNNNDIPLLQSYQYFESNGV
ncbi:conserved Plasmodium protein, unknown function [Plasmodium gallinaceum]|uniref:Uncharacterized protein n=1 Tax=Plasmodium gallinaceum TaxID=5849 RepID=A0A1J1GNP4_PLAGA|nr:conserved Plasmodium protein, unknown function [Plasmodium gallinaceum]CRG93940.1 conserved Plasmodium protein, unknown function [Plasmodium gallinaceum]